MDTETDTTPAPDEAAVTSPVDPRWRRCQRFVAATGLTVAVITIIVAGEVIPPLVVFGVLFAVCLGLLSRSGRLGPIATGVVAVLFIVGSLPFIIEDLAHPESGFGFVPAAVGVLSGLVGAIGLLAVVRRWDGTRARTVLMSAGTIAAIALVAGVGATLAQSDDERRDGDVSVEAKDVEFAPDDIAVDAGSAVYVDNSDPFRHTFIVEDTDIAVELPAGTGRRVTVDADPGTYTLICDVPGHEDMTATLVVE